MNEKYNLLDKLREQINRTDEEILYLLKRRFQTIKKISRYKNEKEIKENNNFENDLIIERIARGRTMEIDENFTRELFELILDESNRIMNNSNK